MNDQTSIKIENRNYIMACTPAIQTSAEIELIKRRIIGRFFKKFHHKSFLSKITFPSNQK